MLTTAALVTALAGLAIAGCDSDGGAGEAAPSPKSQPPTSAVLDSACNATLVTSRPGTVAAPAMTELSGLSASRRTDGVWWAHNDSGDSPRVFAVGNDGRDLGQYALSGASATDWEDIATGPGPDPNSTYLYLADTGDNKHARSSVQVYRVVEPAVDPSAATPAPQTLDDVATLTFTYPDGAHDAEALIVDPSSGALVIVTKEIGGDSQVFQASANLVSGSTTELTQVATLSLGVGGLVTAGDVTPAGDVVGLRTYGSVRLYRRAAGTSLVQAFTHEACDGAVASEPQGEAFGFTRDGRGYVTASEGANPELHRFVAP